MSRAPRAKNIKTDWGSDDSRTPILHVDMDAFFVSCELRDRPELLGRPVAVGGQERGVISAASYEARKYGINSAMPVARAKALCSNLVILPVDSVKYHEASHVIMEILRSYTPEVEQLSIDEAFLDVRSVRKLYGSPRDIGEKIREDIRRAVGVPASVGIASTKHLAKLASAHAKPDGLLLIPEQVSLDFLHALPVGALWGVGDRTRAILSSRGIETVGDIAQVGVASMVSMLGVAQGKQLSALAMNIDPRDVAVNRQEKSISREETFFDPLQNRDAVTRMLLKQSHDVARRLREACVRATTVSIKVRGSDFSTIQRSHTLQAPSARGGDIFDAAQHLWSKAQMPVGGVRLVGVRASQLIDESAGQQLPLGDDGKQDKIDTVLDTLRDRYGAGITRPGSLVQCDGDASHA